MLDYDELSDLEKCADYPEEFIKELRTEFQSGNRDEALTRCENQGLDIREIIE